MAASVSGAIASSAAIDTLSEEQREAVRAPFTRSTLVAAGPGAGKTRVLVARVLYALEMGMQPEELLAVTFTNAAAQEMKDRIRKVTGPHVVRRLWVGTFHALGARLLRRHAREAGVSPDFWIADESDQAAVLKSIGVLDGEIEEVGTWIRRAKDDMKGPEQVAIRAASERERRFALYYRLYQERLREMDALDFGDLVMLAVRLLQSDAAVREGYHARFRHILVDEWQDVNLAQVELINALVGSRTTLFAVGDVDQCQPPGTLVSTVAGPKPIEELRDGDEVLCWDRKSGYVVASKGYPVRVGVRPYDGCLVEVRVGDRTTRVTPNHRFLVRWSHRPYDVWVTYLMYRRDRGYRVGWCQLFREDDGRPSFHLGFRARLERAEKAWILAVHTSKQDASAYESIVSIRYGIPTAMFEPNGQLYTEEVLGRIFSASDRNGALRCLADHHLDPDLPLWPYPCHRDQTGRPTYFECYAANLLPGYMAVPLPGDSRHRYVWAEVDEVHRIPYRGPVYSLDVSPHHNYVADGIVVLNSIYGWRGSRPQYAIEFTRFYPTSDIVRLTQNYRSQSTIVRAADALIRHNVRRIDRDLRAVRTDAHPIRLWTGAHPSEEARLVAVVLEQEHARGVAWNDMAVLYRTNHQAKELENALLSFRIPYHVSGSYRFWDHKEIRDALSLLYLVYTRGRPQDLGRLAGMLPGVGARTVDQLVAYATERSDSDALEILRAFTCRNRKAKLALAHAADTLEALRKRAHEAPPSLALADALDAFEYASQVLSKEPNRQARLGRLALFSRLLKDAEEELAETDGRVDFRDVADLLRFQIDEDTDAGDEVRLMTIHRAKGKEWSVVLVVGCDEGVLPHYLSDSADELEEERRLFYVAITRAKDRLHLFRALERPLPNGRGMARTIPSRFLGEIPASLYSR